MKTIIIIGDGMADEPIAEFGDKTPMQVAHAPYMNKLARLGKNGLLDTIPKGFSSASDIANLTILGYDVAQVYEGRASLEAAAMYVDIQPNELALRCNLISIADGKIKSYSADHISNEEATTLIEYLNNELGNLSHSFHAGVSYRHLLKVKNGSKDIICTPPQDAIGEKVEDILIRTENADAINTVNQLNELILQSQNRLVHHPINLKRISEGKLPANSIWLWSPGYRPQMQALNEKYNIQSGAVISAVNLIKGIGKYAGLQVIDVAGANGLHTTNYEGKAKAAIEALEIHDFVFLHIEASDEAGHDGDSILKTRTIEYLDRRIIKPIYEAIKTWNEAITIAILPDHPTLCSTRMHTNKPVPFLIYRTNGDADKVEQYDEFSAVGGAYGLINGIDFLQLVLQDELNDLTVSNRSIKGVL